VFDPDFSSHSYGFRPGKSAHQAIKAARQYVESGKRWVVDIDLEKFFDRVNHDILMSLVKRKVKDRQVLKLIDSYLKAGMFESGMISPPARRNTAGWTTLAATVKHPSGRTRQRTGKPWSHLLPIC
jgi:hypothetical protein